jgi:hypothetical protein
MINFSKFTTHAAVSATDYPRKVKITHSSPYTRRVIYGLLTIKLIMRSFDETSKTPYKCKVSLNKCKLLRSLRTCYVEKAATLRRYGLFNK